jgi:hypothetical protein
VQFSSSSMPYFSSNGRPVSLQMGKGMYCNSCAAFSMCSPVSLGGVSYGDNCNGF